MKKISTILIALLMICWIEGCGKNVSLKGKVTFSDDQSPLPAGTVFFEADSTQHFGDIQPDGTYVMGTISAKDGLPPGKYRVYVHGVEVPDPTDSSGLSMMPLVDSKFQSASTSGLSVQVDSSTKQFDFSVDPNPVNKAKLK